MPQFHFVDHSDIDGNARKLIRSHVMIGRNLGKTRARKSKYTSRAKDKPARANITRDAYDDDEIEVSMSRLSLRETTLLSVARQVVGNPVLALTTTVVPQARLSVRQITAGIIEAISPPEFCRPTGAVEHAWFQLTFSNEAYFHCMVAVASACAAFLTGNPSHTPLALHHMSETYRLINQLLSSSEALEDDTIAVVTFTTIYDRLYGEAQRSLVHLDGVSQMIDLKGGIRELAKRNFIVAEKAFRSDLELALHCNSTPKFSSADVPRHLVFVDLRDAPLPHGLPNPRIVESALYRSACLDLREAILDVVQFSHILEDQASRIQKLDPAAYHSTIMYVGYRLVEVKMYGEDYTADTSFNILTHLAMTGFMNTFCHCIGRQVSRFPLLSQRFRSTAQTIRVDGESRQMVVFWALLMGKLTLLEDEDDTWLVPKMKAFAENLKLRTWAEVSNAFRPFPWVKAMHEARGAMFWNKTVAPAIPSRLALTAN